MPRKRRTDIYGRRVFARTNSAAAANGKPKRTYVTHGGHSALLKEPLDKRSALGRKYEAGLAELHQHAGGADCTAVQSRLIDQVVRLGLLADISWTELLQSGLIVEGAPAPAVNVFLQASRQYRDGLLQLGVERRSKNVTLSSYLQERQEQEAS